MGPERTSSRNENAVEGRYANFFKIGYNSAEFIIVYGQYYPENDQAELCGRIITHPSYAKSLLSALQATVDEYELKFGEIQQDSDR
ncbi:hypothetical protein D3OALGA1CA_5791 [Olavius algarvensis associated proteobacterium Delta 3]|nr:hypothetical protein D3OALGB2SA_1216 [Olavius algarvensis associated proteobacterium Delta 3]CAB5171904.1 hypothetical protein D3OALGA1CA_5791 [Olavius algarvensis associated proteobacterium Delta 3]